MGCCCCSNTAAALAWFPPWADFGCGSRVLQIFFPECLFSAHRNSAPEEIINLSVTNIKGLRFSALILCYQNGPKLLRISLSNIGFRGEWKSVVHLHAIFNQSFLFDHLKEHIHFEFKMHSDAALDGT